MTGTQPINSRDTCIPVLYPVISLLDGKPEPSTVRYSHQPLKQHCMCWAAEQVH